MLDGQVDSFSALFVRTYTYLHHVFNEGLVKLVSKNVLFIELIVLERYCDIEEELAV